VLSSPKSVILGFRHVDDAGIGKLYENSGFLSFFADKTKGDRELMR
jgi:hypothetical protein